jgi:hypothetical protein
MGVGWRGEGCGWVGVGGGGVREWEGRGVREGLRERRRGGG